MENSSNLGLIYRPRINNALRGPMEVTLRKAENAWEESEELMSETYKIVGAITYSIVLRNQIIINYVDSTIADIEKIPRFYKQETKKAVKVAKGIYLEYRKMVADIMQHDSELMQSLGSITSEYEANIKNQLIQFYYALKQTMDSSRVEDSVLRANVEFCSVLLSVALDAQEVLEKDNLLLRARIRNLGYLKLTKLKYAWEKVRYQINGKYDKGTVDLNTDRAKLACRNLQKAMNDFDMIVKLMVSK